MESPAACAGPGARAGDAHVRIAVGVMARAPSSPGKTRLAPHLTASRLTALNAALLADTLRTVEQLHGVTIFFTPDDMESDVAAHGASALARVPQGDGDLGARMLRALQFLRGCLTPWGQTPRGLTPDGAILVGSDIPLLTVDHLREAEQVLQSSGGVVLGPADDGGYYLIGMTRVHAGMFEGIAWGTASVLTDTLRAAERCGVEARLVRGTYDVDTIDDLGRLERDLALMPADRCPALRRWFRES